MVISVPTARITPASAIHTASLSPEPIRSASSIDSSTVLGPGGRGRLGRRHRRPWAIAAHDPRRARTLQKVPIFCLKPA